MSNNSFYLTNEGLSKIMYERQILENKKDYKMKFEFAVFNHNKRGDPDYINCYEELGFIKNRINEIKNIIKHAKLIRSMEKKSDVVELGATVTLKSEGEKKAAVFTIVDSMETNPAEGKISRKSPLGLALLGHKLKENVFVPSPVNRKYFIKNIEYN